QPEPDPFAAVSLLGVAVRFWLRLCRSGSPWLCSPLRHRGHRESCESLAAGRGFLYVYFACFAVTFPAQWHGRPSLRFCRVWPEPTLGALRVCRALENCPGSSARPGSAPSLVASSRTRHECPPDNRNCPLNIPADARLVPRVAATASDKRIRFRGS